MYDKIEVVIELIDIYEKLERVRNNLDSLELFNKLDEAFSDIEKNDELLEKIKRYNQVPDNNLRLDIYNYEEIRKYKLLENEVNFLILHINEKLKSIDSIRSCNR